MKILAVDDDPTFLELLGAVLASAGFKDVTFAGSAPEAAQIIGDAERPFDCCFIDMRMPEIEGDYLCRWIRRLPNYRDKVILMITATSEKQDVERAFLAGASDYMSKPVDLTELITRARQIARNLGEMGPAKRKAPEPVPVQQPAQTPFYEPMAIEGVKRSLELTALENYLLQLSRDKGNELSAVSFRLLDAAKLHLRCSSAEYGRVVTAVAKAILAHAELPHPFIAYAGQGIFVVVADTVDLDDDDRQRIETAINDELAATLLAQDDGTPVEPRVSMFEPQKLGSRTGQQMADALYHTIVRAETASFNLNLNPVSS